MSNETEAMIIKNRINLLTQRGPTMNMRLINKLKRRLRKIS